MIRKLGYPLLFNGVLWCVFFILMIVSAHRQMLPLLILSFFLGIVGAISWFLSRWCMKGVFFCVEPEQTRAFPDESIDMVFQVKNDKAFPVPWLEIEQTFPHRLVTGSLRSISPFSGERFYWTTTVSGRQHLTWRFPLTCKGRGEHRLGPARLRFGDLFGIFPKEMILPQNKTILVYPRILPLDKLSPELKDLIGDIDARRSIYEDLNRQTSPRDYQHEDPFKRIHWKATAKQGFLQVRQFESSIGLRFVLALDAAGYLNQGIQGETAFETAISLAASLAHECCGRGWPTGLLANVSPVIRIAASSGPHQRLIMLEALAKAQLRSGISLKYLFEGDCSIISPTSTIVIIAHDPTPELSALIMDLKRCGYALWVATTGHWPSEACTAGVAVLPIPCLLYDGPTPQEKAL